MRGVLVTIASLALTSLAGACSGSKAATPSDGGVSDGMTGDGGLVDAMNAIDAMPDATPCASPSDVDGDGTCDSNDVCPTTPDPGQADLDGDHLGWMCDPVESITMAALGVEPFVQASIYEDTFAARTKILCSGITCGHVLLQVGAAGMLHARSDSTSAVDAWHASPSAIPIEGPYVTADSRVLWSRGDGTGDTGEFDLATRTYTVRASGVFNRDDIRARAAVYAGGSLLAVALSTASNMLTQNLVEIRADGTLPTIHTAQGFTNFTSGDSLALPGTTPRALVPVRANFQQSLKLYTQGQPALSDVIVDSAPLANLSSLTHVLVDGYPRAFCVARGGTMLLISWDQAGVIASHELPISSCQDLEATDRGPARILTQNYKVIGYVFAGAFHPMPPEFPTLIVGNTLPLLLYSQTQVWLLRADGTSTVVVSGLNSAVASMSGDTIHVFAHRKYPNDPTYGTWDLLRFRPGQPMQSVTLIENSPNGIGAGVFTTAEGAAFVRGGFSDVIVPSQSMTAVTSPVGDIQGGIRDGRTVVFANPGPFMPGNVYLYSELNGAPQLTPLDTAGTEMRGWVIDDGHQPTSWFTYQNQTIGCRLARLTQANTVYSVPCSDVGAVRVVGTRADGVMFISAGDMYAITSAGAQRVGVGGTPILDTSLHKPVLVGWSGTLGSNDRFSCLAMHPDRCWAHPAPGGLYLNKTIASATANSGSGSFQHIIQQFVGSGQTKLTIVRSIGLGNVTP